MRMPLLTCVLAAICAASAFAQNGYATKNGDAFGRCLVTNYEYTFAGRGADLAPGFPVNIRLTDDRPASRSQIVFDNDGNVYWRTSTGGATAGLARVLSLFPNGTVRWRGNVLGVTDPLEAFNNTSPIIGDALVYTVDRTRVIAYSKATGDRAWVTLLPDSLGSDNFNRLQPILYGGKLYIAGEWNSSGNAQAITFYRVDATTGAIDGSSMLFLNLNVQPAGTMAIAPNAFGSGEHAVYFNVDGGNNNPDSVYCVRYDTTGSPSIAWVDKGGKVGRSHMIYNPQTSRLYACTWSDYGSQLYVYDPALGYQSEFRNTPNSGHGFFDVNGLSSDGMKVIAGGFGGLVIIYNLNNNTGDVDSELVIQTNKYYQETRTFVQLVEDDGRLLMLTGTRRGEEVRDDVDAPLDACPPYTGGKPFYRGTLNNAVIMVDVLSGQQLWKWEFPNGQESDFDRGGPLMGPNGNVYLLDINGLFYVLVPKAQPQSTLRGAFDSNDPAGLGTNRHVNSFYGTDFAMGNQVPLEVAFYNPGHLGDPNHLAGLVNTTLDGDGTFEAFTDLTGAYDVCMNFYSPASDRLDNPLNSTGREILNLTLSDEMDLGVLQLTGGDTNGDWIVDDADLTNAILDFGTPGGVNGSTDVDGDGEVGDSDLTLIILNFGSGCKPHGSCR